jgi:hypothetical protein
MHLTADPRLREGQEQPTAPRRHERAATAAGRDHRSCLPRAVPSALWFVLFLAALLTGCAAGFPPVQDRPETYAIQPSRDGALGRAVLPTIGQAVTD